MALSPLPPLALVECRVLRAATPLHALPHVAELVALFLDPSPLLTPATAAAMGSLRLFARVMQLYDASIVDDSVHSFWCGKALDVAIQKNDLAMVQNIHALHPEPLAVRSLLTAFQYGTLEMVQWIVEHRHDRLCCGSGVQNLCGKCAERALFQVGSRDTKRIVEWCYNQRLFDPMTSHPMGVASTMRHSVEVFDWYASLGLLKNYTASQLIGRALSGGNHDLIPLLKRILDNARSFRVLATLPALIHLSLQSDQEEHIAQQLQYARFRDKVAYASVRDSGPKVLQWDPTFLMTTQVDYVSMAQWIARVAAESGHIDTMQWLVSTGTITAFAPPGAPSLTDANLLEVHTWLHENDVGNWHLMPLIRPIELGNLELVQWYDAHRPVVFSALAMDYAAKDGQLHILKWLHENRTEGCTDGAMEFAAANGHHDIVQWLFEHTTAGHTNFAMASAVLGGHLDVVMWLCENRSDACPACVIAFVLSYAHGMMDDTPLLHTLKWLNGHAFRRDVCNDKCCTKDPSRLTRGVTEQAISVGDVQLLEYIHEHHGQHLDTLAHQNGMVAQSHIGCVQWMFTHRHGAYDWPALRDLPARMKFPRITGWLDSVL